MYFRLRNRRWWNFRIGLHSCIWASPTRSQNLVGRPIWDGPYKPQKWSGPGLGPKIRVEIDASAYCIYPIVESRCWYCRHGVEPVGSGVSAGRHSPVARHHHHHSSHLYDCRTFNTRLHQPSINHALGPILCSEWARSLYICSAICHCQTVRIGLVSSCHRKQQIKKDIGAYSC